MAQLYPQRRLAHEIAIPAVVRWALKTFSPYKSPGPVGIYPVLLQRAGEPVVGPLVKLARASLTLGYSRGMEGHESGLHSESRQERIYLT